MAFALACHQPAICPPALAQRVFTKRVEVCVPPWSNLRKSCSLSVLSDVVLLHLSVRPCLAPPCNPPICPLVAGNHQAQISCWRSMQQMYLGPSCVAAWLRGNVASVSCYTRLLP